jgi:hypothetical protein
MRRKSFRLNSWNAALPVVSPRFRLELLSGKMRVMVEVDLWGEFQRRDAKRYFARWKVALVFDSSIGRPIFHTVTHDLSISGMSGQSDKEVMNGTFLTVLLLPPPLDGVRQGIVRLQAVVMSSQAFRGAFRLGMSFVQDSELKKLHGILEKFDLSGESLPSDSEEQGLPKLI